MSLTDSEADGILFVTPPLREGRPVPFSLAAEDVGGWSCLWIVVNNMYAPREVPFMFGVGIPELLVVLLVVLLVFGYKRLPEIGGGLGRAIRNFRRATSEPDEIDITAEGQKQASAAGDAGRKV